jgi:hypothetical protein
MWGFHPMKKFPMQMSRRFLIPFRHDVTIDMSIKLQTRCRDPRENILCKKNSILALYGVFVTLDVDILSKIEIILLFPKTCHVRSESRFLQSPFRS